MKQRLVLAAMAAFALSSCSKNEVTEVLNPSDNINSIGLSAAAGVTRGVETNTELVEGSNDLVLSYFGIAAADETNAGESVTGDLNMVYNGAKDAWDQKDLSKAKLWSSLELPAYFYSMHAGDAPLTANTVSTDNAVFDAYTPAAVIADQKDLVCYAGEVSAMPLAGYIRGDFNHALSRLEIYSNQGTYNPLVKSVDFMNLKDSGVATLTNAGVCTWAPAATATSYEYFKAASGATLAAADKDFVSETATAYEAKNMIIVPQALKNAKNEITELNGSSDPVVATETGYVTEAAHVMTISAFARIEGSYIKVLYRMKDAANAEVAGYTEAKDCRSYQSMVANGELILPATIDDNSELYILAGFPFADGQSFDVNKDYDIKLGFGINGGYLLYDYYFDADGNPTNIKVHGIETNDPVINPDAPIGIMVTVSDWVAVDSDVVTE